MMPDLKNRKKEGRRNMSKDRAIVAQCAFKGAIDLCVAEKIQMSEIMDYTYNVYAPLITWESRDEGIFGNSI